MNFDFVKVKLAGVLQNNLIKLNKKLSDPSIKVTLESTANLVQSLNNIIKDKNTSITTFNNKLKKKKDSLSTIRTKFWSLVRIKFDEDIQTHNSLLESLNTDIKTFSDEEVTLTTAIKAQNNIISDNRKKISNIETSIININNQLKTIGLIGFEIKEKQEESQKYYLCRGEVVSGAEVYKSLSEGEKTLITYLYFLELCQGSVNIDSTIPRNNKIIVIDDPISSLSHNYIYEIASLTHKKLIKENQYAQIILFTHSLYYLHEVIKQLRFKDKDFDKNRNIFRVLKNTNSNILPMKKNDIQNDYQSYWQIIKDAQNGNVNNIILPNVMRNILEYYFSFIHKKTN